MKNLIYAIIFMPSLSFSAITSIGSLGSWNQGVSTAAWTVVTTATLEQGNAAFCIWASDNDGNGTDGDDFTTMTSTPSTNWVSIDGLTDFENERDPGANNAGAVVVVFRTVASVTLSTGSTLTINNATAEVARAGTCWEFDVLDNAVLIVSGAQALEDTNGDAGSLTVNAGAGLREYLWIRGIASETTDGGILLNTLGWTTITAATFNSGTEATSMGVAGEFIIATATSQTSDPIMNDLTADRASAFNTFWESGAGGGIFPQIIIVE